MTTTTVTTATVAESATVIIRKSLISKNLRLLDKWDYEGQWIKNNGRRKS